MAPEVVAMGSSDIFRWLGASGSTALRQCTLSVACPAHPILPTILWRRRANSRPRAQGGYGDDFLWATDRRKWDIAWRSGQYQEAQAHIDLCRKYDWERHHEIVAETRARREARESAQPDGGHDLRREAPESSLRREAPEWRPTNPWAQFRVQPESTGERGGDANAGAEGTSNAQQLGVLRCAAGWKRIVLQ